MTVAPKALPSWIAAEPTPPAPACTSSVSPGCSRARSTRLNQLEMERVVQRGALGIAQPVGDQHRAGRVDDRVLGEAAVGAHRDADDAPPDQVLRARAGALDDAHRFHARDERRLQRHDRPASAHDVGVVEVHAERRHLDAHLARARVRVPRPSGAPAPSSASPSAVATHASALSSVVIGASVSPGRFSARLGACTASAERLLRRPLPFEAGGERHRIGVRPIERVRLARDRPVTTWRASCSKSARIFDAHRGAVLATLPGAQDACLELLELVRESVGEAADHSRSGRMPPARGSRTARPRGLLPAPAGPTDGSAQARGRLRVLPEPLVAARQDRPPGDGDPRAGAEVRHATRPSRRTVDDAPGRGPHPGTLELGRRAKRRALRPAAPRRPASRAGRAPAPTVAAYRTHARSAGSPNPARSSSPSARTRRRSTSSTAIPRPPDSSPGRSAICRRTSPATSSAPKPRGQRSWSGWTLLLRKLRSESGSRSPKGRARGRTPSCCSSAWARCGRRSVRCRRWRKGRSGPVRPSWPASRSRTSRGRCRTPAPWAIPPSTGTIGSVAAAM